MRRFFIFISVFILLLSATACSAPVVKPVSNPVSPPADDSVATTQEIEKLPVVDTVREEKVTYFCAQCAGDCNYFTGLFCRPAIVGTDEAAVAINDAIMADYEKYLALATDVGESGLAYGFDFASHETDTGLVILRTAVETVFLHKGGTYSYDFYYYDTVNAREADIAAVCGCFGFDINVLAAFLRLELAGTGGYDDGQLESITADCIDIFPLADGDTFYIRVQNDRLKYETQFRSADLNNRGEEIASVMALAEPIEPATAENESVSEPTIEQDIIYMEY